jgi:predicted ATPase
MADIAAWYLRSVITTLHVSNFRSLAEDVRVDFGRFTALVGPNGSGKSSVVDALRFVADCMHMGLNGAITSRSGINGVRRWSGGHPYNLTLRLQLHLEAGPAAYEFELVGDSDEEYRIKSEAAVLTDATGGSIRFRVDRGNWIEGPDNLRPPVNRQSLALPLVGGDKRFEPLFQALQNIAIYSIFPDVLRAPQKYSPARPMELHGANWSSVLRDQGLETWKPELVAVLGKLTGDIEDIRIEPAAGLLVVQFKHRSPNKKLKWFDAAQESDGTLRVAGIVTALLQEPFIPVLGVEEPELTVHPGAIALLFDYLKEASKRSQIIVTTHSPELLDRVDADDVRVVERIDGITTVARMANTQRETVRTGLLTLGEVLRTEGLQQQPLGL